MKRLIVAAFAACILFACGDDDGTSADAGVADSSAAVEASVDSGAADIGADAAKQR